MKCNANQKITDRPVSSPDAALKQHNREAAFRRFDPSLGAWPTSQKALPITGNGWRFIDRERSRGLKESRPWPTKTVWCISHPAFGL
jgi:hypothetical protein